MSLLDKVRALLGPAAVLDAAAPDGLPRVAPDSVDGVAVLLGTAHTEGWRVRVEGTGSWLPSDAPADLALTTRRLDRLVSVTPEDLVATAQAGLGLDLLRHGLADRGAWLALDPPGMAGRTLGSVLASATAGALRHGFGPVRDHVLGVTVVTGDGRVVRSGGRVMKNVAGYDLGKLHVGGFGAFGVIVEAHLRLRALPRVDVTFILEDDRERLMGVLDTVREAGVEPAALELVSPALARRSRWVLAARLAGSAELVGGAETTLSAATDGRIAPLRADEAAAFWRHAAEGVALRPVALRVGALAAGADEVLDLLSHHLGDEWISATPERGAVRWAGDPRAERLRHVRHTLAELEVPLTLERAPWTLRRALGHFGAYREGVGPLVSGLRRTFDPGGRLVVATEGDAADV